ncbi:hypothetical protein PCANC_00796 [Puccinia coronata f. sp. avenae]|uniref:Uncharacterized protein n=1 Tax=Puccinia coronata f. sp. avenae TaxID=200324 RepID=A0A2N5TEB3_9BASI|nr:hypothetical protein PCANC_13354 [Puccinia coronata f. sp. avenae]PLW23836.1 hypothetical protein PCASD_10625 [Puccinia coronata f. sp. avenae]PLW38029.1 hypothetical protein PCASD_09926 [Puccinia coronata f. sp. avenae]PLW58205.1 hypothetical protein PCANC_00796 [Puccinia coronata f. sp. avenae]
MVAFKYGEWDYICRVSPQPICNLFFRQLLVHPDRGLQAAPDPYLGLSTTTDPSARDALLKELGLGLRSPCSIPRMEAAGGKFDSVGNAANIVICCLSIFVVAGLVIKCFRRKAAVARMEMMILLGLYGLMKFFEILDTGAILEQGSQSIVWLTSIHHALTVLFFFALVWLAFLSLQLVEDGSKFSLLPLASSLAFLFFGSIYIFLDTGFGVTHYFSSQPASHLYSPWTFSMVILWPFIALGIYAVVTVYVSVRILGELKPVAVLLCGMMAFALGTIFRWILTQPICHSSGATVDGSFLGSLLELGALALLVYIWACLTEAEWDEYGAGLGLPCPPPPPAENKFLNNHQHHHTPVNLDDNEQLVVVDRPASRDDPRDPRMALENPPFHPAYQHFAPAPKFPLPSPAFPNQQSNQSSSSAPAPTPLSLLDDPHGPLVDHSGTHPLLHQSDYKK